MSDTQPSKKIDIPSLGWLILAVVGMLAVLAGKLGYVFVFLLLAVALTDR